MNETPSGFQIEGGKKPSPQPSVDSSILRSRKAETFVQLTACAGAALALTAMVGWVFDIAALKSIIPGLSTLKMNTAVCFLLSSVALWLIAKRQSSQEARICAYALAGLAATIGLLTLAEYVSGTDFVIDQLLLKDTTTPPNAMPGRMSTITALEFVIFAVTIGASRIHGRRAELMFLVSATAGSLIALLGLMGYLYKLPLLYSPIPESSIALHTAGGFFALFLGAFALRPENGWIALLRSNNTTGVLARWLLPSIILIPLLLGVLILWGVDAGVFAPRDAVALFSLASIISLSAVAWSGGSYANHLGARLKRREGVLQTVMESALDAFILMDARGRVIEWNPQAESLFGRNRSEVLGKSVADLIIPEDQRAAHMCGLARFLKTGEGRVLRRRIEVEAVRQDGGKFPAELMVLPAKDGDAWLFSAFLRDLTSLKEAEAKLLQAQKLDVIGQLTGGVAHDFNNLLTVILANAETLSEELGDASLQSLAEMTRKAAQRGAELTNCLLAFARRQPLNPRPVDVQKLISGMDGLLRRTIGAQIEIEFVRDAGLWQATVDPTQLEATVLNLAINARDAMPDGGKLTVETGNAFIDTAYSEAHNEVAPGQYVMICVTDTGCGMTPDVVTRVFEPFFTTKGKSRGTGLGLSTAFGFVKQTGGHIKIYSEPGQGTAVKVYLPRAAASDTIGENNSIASSDQRGGSETILLVEDNDLVREHATTMLRSLGYRVFVADRAAAATPVLDSAEQIDLLFTDVVMPGGMSGKELAAYSENVRPNLPVLFTSGYTENAIVHHGRLDPGVEFIRKPYGKRELAMKLRQVLDLKNSGKRKSA